MASYEALEKLTSKNEAVMRISPIAATFLATINNPQVFEHGGGCRKNSPPGQCCHMNHKTGIVHCH